MFSPSFCVFQSQVLRVPSFLSKDMTTTRRADRDPDWRRRSEEASTWPVHQTSSDGITSTGYPQMPMFQVGWTSTIESPVMCFADSTFSTVSGGLFDLNSNVSVDIEAARDKMWGETWWWQEMAREQDSLQQKIMRQNNRVNQQLQEIRLLQAQLRERQTTTMPHRVVEQKKAFKAVPKPRPRPPAPATVPQHLWDKALDEAPRIAGQLRWVLRERSKYGLVHDSRLKENFTARFARAVAGLRCRKAHHGTDGSKDEHWRHGTCVREHEKPGKWWATFDDDPEKEEVIDCGFGDYYDTNPLPPQKTGEIVSLPGVDDGVVVYRCRNPISGEYYETPTGDVVEVKVVPDLRVIELRRIFEEHCGHPNGLQLITPSKRVLDPCEDHRHLDETLLASEEDIMSDENKLVLELFHVKKDGTQTLFWHSGTTRRN